MSKGSKRRPSSVSEDVVEENWKRTFGKRQRKPRAHEYVRSSTAAKLRAYVEELKAAEAPLTTPHTENEATT